MRNRIGLPAAIALAILHGLWPASLASGTSPPDRDRQDLFLPCPGSPSMDDPPSRAGPLRKIWREHRYHLLTVLLIENADRFYEQEVGPPDNPRLFGSPPGIDRAVSSRFEGRASSRSLVTRNKTAILQALSVSAILWVNEGRWEQSVHDAIGLYEAHKISWSVSSLVKNVVGRRRPSLQGDYEREGPGILAGATISQRNSFPSDAAARAFTYMAYTDSILARRLRGNRQARIWSAVGLYGLASTIAYSRLERGRHYLSDVVAGAGAGLLAGKVVYRVNHRKRDRDETAWTIRPMLVPGGAGLSVSFRPER